MKKLLILMLAGMLAALPALAIEENVPLPLGTSLPPYQAAAPGASTLKPLPGQRGATPLPPLPKPTPLPVAQPTALPVVQATLPPDVDFAGSEYSSSSMQALYADIGEEMYPALTADEKGRLPAVLSRYEKGGRPQRSILNIEENVSLGVYTLKPSDYEENEAYALLPGRALSDDEIMQLVDAFAQLGLPFGEDTLSFRNCARGGASDRLRPLTNDENARRAVLQKLYRRQELRPQAPFTALPGDDGIGEIRLNPEDYHGMERFIFLPYRPLTDEELLRFIDFESSSEPKVSTQQYAEYERKAREALRSILGAPLAMEIASEQVVHARAMADFLPDVLAYSVCFQQTGGEGRQYDALLDIKTDKLLWSRVRAEDQPDLPYETPRFDPSDEKWQRIAKDYISAVRRDGVGIKAAWAESEVVSCGTGRGAFIHVRMQDGGEYRLTVLFSTEQVSPIIEYLGQALPAR